ncbi:MAG TPA: YitT family protein [Firmicutes bacterium]|nr:YitT family protein [Bacillota bacterium]
MIIIGVAFMAVSLNIFLVPNRIAAGGVSGLGVILLYLINVPVGVTILAANLPLMLITWWVIGFKFVVNSVIGALLLSLFVEALSFLQPITGDLLLASIYGGILMGIGTGIVFRAQASTGGTALAARLINHYFGFTIGQSFLFIDFFIIFLALVFFNPEVALYALLSLFVASKVTDLVQEGFAFSKAALIISPQSRQIAGRVLEEMGRGATVLKAEGAFTGEEKEVVLVVMSQGEVSRLKALVYDIDPRAFVVISNASEVLGEGFRLRT